MHFSPRALLSFVSRRCHASPRHAPRIYGKTTCDIIRSLLSRRHDSPLRGHGHFRRTVETESGFIGDVCVLTLSLHHNFVGIASAKSSPHCYIEPLVKPKCGQSSLFGPVWVILASLWPEIIMTALWTLIRMLHVPR